MVKVTLRQERQRLTARPLSRRRLHNLAMSVTSVKSKILLCIMLIFPLLSACSIVMVDGPPVGYERFNYVPCTRSKVVPAVDGLASSISAWLGVMMLADDQNGFNIGKDLANKWGVSKNGAIISNLAFGVLTGVSGYKGFKKTVACREAQLELAARNREITALNRDEPLQSIAKAMLDQLPSAPIFGADMSITIPLAMPGTD
mgnify:CR=1 FL=1